ncbi:MAG: hypothetical protein LUI87_15690 [Lachnospiraceae bacterium]|nr:hypothetical protein [Lachnospiraceae bacterium]
MLSLKEIALFLRSNGPGSRAYIDWYSATATKIKYPDACITMSLTLRLFASGHLIVRNFTVGEEINEASRKRRFGRILIRIEMIS